MKTKFLMCCFLMTASSAVAGEFTPVRTDLGVKVGETVILRSDLTFLSGSLPTPDPIDGHPGSAKLPMRLSVGPIQDSAKRLSKIVDSAPSYTKFENYTELVTGSDMFVKDAPMYGNVNRLITTSAMLETAGRVFGGKDDLKVEVYEGLQDILFYSESRRDGDPVYDANECTVYTQLPIWTLRFSNSSGESFDMIYRGLYGTTDFRDARNKFFPKSGMIEIQGEPNCTKTRNEFIASPDRVSN